MFKFRHEAATATTTVTTTTKQALIYSQKKSTRKKTKNLNLHVPSKHLNVGKTENFYDMT